MLRTYRTANLEWDQAVTADTAFQLASSTKPFTGLQLMHLVGAGRLGLDQPITAHLALAPPAWREVTLRHLADHSSGIPDDVRWSRGCRSPITSRRRRACR